MSDIEEILTVDSPTLPDYCQLGGRVFVCDGYRVNKVIMNRNGDWRPMGAREQIQPMAATFAEDEDGGLHYGERVTYALRRVVSCNGLDVAGGMLVEYYQCPSEQVAGGTSTFRLRVTVRRTVDIGGTLTTTEKVTVTAWDGSVTKTETTYTGVDADDEVGETRTEERPTLAATITVLPYEYNLPDNAEVTYEIYRSKPENTMLLYKVATLTADEVEHLTDNLWTDEVAELPDAESFSLESDGWEMTIPVCRYIRAWKGSLVCGGSYRAKVTVTGEEGSTEITGSPVFVKDDIGSFITVVNEPFTYQIMDVDEDGAATLDGELAEDHDGEEAERWRDDDVVYISRPLAGNIEVYSAENGRLISNQGSDNCITGIAVNGMYGYIFRRNNVEILTGTPDSPALEPHPAAPPGCRSHATIADMMTPMVIYYAGVNGVWTLQGAQAQRVSGAVDVIIENEIDHSQDEFSHGVYDPASRTYHLFVFSRKWRDLGIRMPDMMLVYDTATGFWTIGELSCSRSGLFKTAAGELRPVVATPGGIALLGMGDSDGDNTLTARVESTTVTTVTLSESAEGARIMPGQPIHLMRTLDEVPKDMIRRLVRSISGNVIEIYGELPEGDMAGWMAMIGAIRWRVKTPEIGLSGDYDRQLSVCALSLAHWREKTGTPVTVTARTRGEMSGRKPDSQRWQGVFDFSTRSVSRIDGKATGLRGASLDVEVEGSHGPATVKAIRVEATRVAR